MNIVLLVKIRLETLWASIRALKEYSRNRHDEARLAITDERRSILRQEGDIADTQAEEIKKAIDDELKHE